MVLYLVLCKLVLLFIIMIDRSGTIGDESIQGYVDRRCIEEGDVRRTRCPDQLLGISDE